MLLTKTDQAREALRAGSAAGLSLQDRRILILTDGKRSLNEVMAMLGPDVLPAIDRLIRGGYIAPSEPSPATTPAIGGAVAGLLRAATEAVQARTEQIRATRATPAATESPVVMPEIPVTTVPASSAAPVGRSRRSLAACKMYMLDMLQLQRSADAAELRTVVQCATDPVELVDAILRGLRLIVAVSTPSYGERVTHRLTEILPLEALPRLEAMRAERGPPTLSIVA